jgi:large subunit ribosomal protein L23
MKITPRISEQTYAQASKNVFVFNTPITANRSEIKAAIEKQFDVTVVKVNTTIVKGKLKASNRRNQRAVYGARSDVKKAYVTLKEGDKIGIFEEIE